MDISLKFYVRLLIALFCLPLILFFLGFFHMTYGLIFTAILLGLIYRLDFEAKEAMKLQISLSKRHLFFALFAIFSWCYFAGIGHFWYQNYDYTKHNGILFDLVNRPWPIYYPETSNGGPFYLVYYLGHYLLAGFVGKIFNYPTAELFLLFMTVAILFCCYQILSQLSFFKMRPWVWALFPICGGLDLIGSIFFTQAADLQFGELPEWWSGGGSFQYTGNTHALFWVPQHALGCWITMTLFIFAYQHRLIFLQYVLLVVSFFWSPFVMMGVLPFSLLCLWRQWSELKKQWTPAVVGILGSFILGLVLFSYYSTIPQASPKENMIDHLGGFWEFLPRYLRFVFLEFVILLSVVFLGLKKMANVKEWRPLFFVLVFVLFLWPLYYYGIFSDFSMRASLPSLFLMFFFAFAVIAQLPKKSKIFLSITFLLILGSFSFVSDIYRGFAKKGEYYRPDSMASFNKDIVFQYLGDPHANFFKDFFRDP
ncbi:MAG: hypothetical protein QE271_06025 [Bacteriovoracaceae bacterium]|nr:hypothetical protein [Bacteriovoracaceae bacterium]